MIGTPGRRPDAPADLGAFEVGQARDRARSDPAAARRPSSTRRRRCRRSPRRSRASAGAGQRRAGSRPRRRRAGCGDRGVMQSVRRAGAASLTGAGTTIVNCAPPSGQFSAQIAALFHRQQAAGDPQAHAGARRPRLRRVAAVEPLEQVGQVGRRDAGAVVADGDRQAVAASATRGRRSSSPPACTARRSRAGAPARPRSAADRAAPARPDRPSTSSLCRRSVCSTWSRAAATISDGCAQRDSVAIAPASMRAISRMFWNSRVRRSTSARISSLCSSRRRPSATAP